MISAKTILSIAPYLIPNPYIKGAVIAINAAIKIKDFYKEGKKLTAAVPGAPAGEGEAEWEAYYGGYWRDIHPGFKEDISKAGNVFTRCIRWDGKGFRSYRNDRGLIIRRKLSPVEKFMEDMEEQDAFFTPLDFEDEFDFTNLTQVEDVDEEEQEEEDEKEKLENLSNARGTFSSQEKKAAVQPVESTIQRPTSSDLFRLGEQYSTSNFITGRRLEQRRLGL